MKGQLTLVSEAVRGEGALLLDTDGVRFMPDVHPMAELAPRDIVAHAIVRRMARDGRRPRLAGRPAPGRGVPAPRASRRSTTGCRARDRHDHRPGPGRARRSTTTRAACVTDLVGRTTRARPVRRGGGRLHGRARRQPARVELAAGGPGVRHAAARHIAAQAASGALGRRSSGPGAAALVAAASRARVQRIASDGPGVLRSGEGLQPRDGRAGRRAHGRAPAQRRGPPAGRTARSPSGRRRTCTRWRRC